MTHPSTLSSGKEGQLLSGTVWTEDSSRPLCLILGQCGEVGWGREEGVGTSRAYEMNRAGFCLWVEAALGSLVS